MNEFGVVGLGVMGKALTFNMENQGFSISTYDHVSDVVFAFEKLVQKDQKILCFSDLKAFVSSLLKPRKILLMITAGNPVDSVLNQLLPLLEPGDVIADGGNSYYKDTMKRYEYCQKYDISFLGIGISGGENGALTGPSLMPSGDVEAYQLFEPLLNKIAAKTKTGKPCSTYIGPSGSGHFVKMIHNGIEYADIQLLCEAYQILKEAGYSNQEMANIFDAFQNSRLQCYLIGITSEILRKKDLDTNQDLIDCILDVAGQKGTGLWTSVEGLQLGVPVNTIAESVYARYLSTLKPLRVRAATYYPRDIQKQTRDETIVNKLFSALYCAKLIVYAQGFNLIQHASRVYDWEINLADLAMIWQSGCIIQAELLEQIQVCYQQQPELESLLLDSDFIQIIKENDFAFRDLVIYATQNRIAIPALSSSLAYFDSFTTASLPANLLQALRDYFGAHTYQRVDCEASAFFHTNWRNI
jgi:6-phosphogluconate dehydrogenase